jgi:peptide deformylase
VIHPIRLYGDPVLRRVAAPVTRFDDELRRLASDMIETMHDAHGVGLAGPQIGVPRRLFVALELEAPEHAAGQATDAEPPAASGGEDEDEHEGEGEEAAPRVVATHVMVNPEIVAREGTQVAPDGCLSVPGLWVEEMQRDAAVRIRYQDLDGALQERRADGHFAHVLQHELDHLDGVLYFDRLADEARRAFLEEHRRELADMQRRAKALLKELRGAGARAS